MNLHDWIDELCDTLELEDVEVDEGLLSDVGQTATRRVHRAAAPVTTYLLGLAAGTQGAGLTRVEELARRVEALATAWGRPAGGAVPDAVPPADEGRAAYAGELDLGHGDEDDLAEVS